MGTRDPRVDTYIASRAPFAQPILTEVRELVHEVCPEVEETIKWGSPAFTYHGILCILAGFKAHCAIVVKGAGPGSDEAPSGMGQFGKITSPADLPSRRVLTAELRRAMARNEAGPASRPVKTKPRPALRVPADLAAALRRSAKARATFERLSPSQRRDYIEWITEAKRDETRARRLATTIEWLAEGKTRNWKYEK